MVKGCILCKKPFGRHPHLTFHVFPSNEDMRKRWFQAIGKEYDKRKYIYLCSNHFVEEDFIVKSGNRYLKKDAIPTLILQTENSHKVARKRFPRDEIMDAWIKALDLGQDWVWTRNKYVCSIHFTLQDFTNQRGQGRRVLKLSAVPSLLLSEDVHSKKTVFQQSIQQIEFTIPSQPGPSGMTQNVSSPDTSASSGSLEANQKTLPKILCMQRANGYPKTSQDIVKTEFDGDSAEYLSSDSPIAWKIESLDDYNSLDGTDSYKEDDLSLLPDDACNPVQSSESNLEKFLYVENDEDPTSPVDDVSESDLFTQSKRRNVKISEDFDECDALNVSDVGMPNRELAGTKLTIVKQRNKIRTLQKTIKRLRVKVNTLNLLFKYLRDNGLVTDMGHSVMRAFVRK